MRKATAIFFLALFLLYHVGYLGYYWYSAQQIDEQWLAHVEITPDMKHVSIPITLPYWNDQSTYRVAHGKINIDGKVYRKVMQKYEKDAIHLILAEDRKTAALHGHIADWVQAMSDSETPVNGKSEILISIAKDYTLDNLLWVTMSTVSTLENNHCLEAPRSLSIVFGEVSTPPPQG